MNQRFLDFYMDIAKRTAQMSRAVRLKVGCIAVKDNRIISFGWNGTPAGWNNACEVLVPDPDYEGNAILKTKPEVLHAEANCLMKLAASPESSIGAVLFLTHSPCIECAKLIYQAGIVQVYYAEDYRTPAGLDFLRKVGVQVHKLTSGTSDA